MAIYKKKLQDQGYYPKYYEDAGGKFYVSKIKKIKPLNDPREPKIQIIDSRINRAELKGNEHIKLNYSKNSYKMMNTNSEVKQVINSDSKILLKMNNSNNHNYNNGSISRSNQIDLNIVKNEIVKDFLKIETDDSDAVKRLSLYDTKLLLTINLKDERNEGNLTIKQIEHMDDYNSPDDLEMNSLSNTVLKESTAIADTDIGNIEMSTMDDAYGNSFSRSFSKVVTVSTPIEFKDTTQIRRFDNVSTTSTDYDWELATTTEMQETTEDYVSSEDFKFETVLFHPEDQIRLNQSASSDVTDVSHHQKILENKDGLVDILSTRRSDILIDDEDDDEQM